MGSFLQLEQAGGEPIDVVTFAREQSAYRYCSSDKPLTIGAFTYLPAAIAVGTHTDSNEDTSATIVVSLSRTTQVVTDLFTGVPPSNQRVICTTFRHQVGATSSDPITAFVGEVTAWAFKGDTVEVTVSLLPLDLERPIPRLMFARTCQNAHYDARCGLNAENFAVNTTVSAVNADGSLSIGALTGGQVATGQYKFLNPFEMLVQAPPISWGISPTGFFTVSGLVITLSATPPGSGPYGQFIVNSDDTMTLAYNSPQTPFNFPSVGFYSLNAAGTVITASATQVAGAFFFNGGFYTFNGIAVAIEAITGGSPPKLYSLGPQAPGVGASSVIRLYPGCDKTPNTCIHVFNNFKNFIGFPNIPDRDAFNEGLL